MCALCKALQYVINKEEWINKFNVKIIIKNNSERSIKLPKQ